MLIKNQNHINFSLINIIVYASDARSFAISKLI